MNAKQKSAAIVALLLAACTAAPEAPAPKPGAIAPHPSVGAATAAETEVATNPGFVDDRCQPTSAPLEEGSWQVFYQAAFTAEAQPYLLSAVRYEDGGVNLCLSNSSFTQAELLSAAEIQGAYIDRIVQTSSPALFLVTVYEGNDIGAPVTQYRLDLSRPTAPLLTLQ